MRISCNTLKKSLRTYKKYAVRSASPLRFQGKQGVVLCAANWSEYRLLTQNQLYDILSLKVNIAGKHDVYKSTKIGVIIYEASFYESATDVYDSPVSYRVP